MYLVDFIQLLFLKYNFKTVIRADLIIITTTTTAATAATAATATAISAILYSGDSHGNKK